MSHAELQALAAAAGEQPPAFDFTARPAVMVVGSTPAPKAFWS